MYAFFEFVNVKTEVTFMKKTKGLTWRAAAMLLAGMLVLIYNEN